MKKIFSIFLSLIAFQTINAQADFIELGSPQYNFIERLEIKLQRDSVFNFSCIKPYDRYNLDICLKNNFDWKKNLGDTSLLFKNLFSKKHLQTPFYFGVKRGDFSFYSHLMYNFQMSKDNTSTSKVYNNTREVAQWRGQFTKRIGYYTYATDIQMRMPTYARNYATNHTAIPGLGYFKGDISPGSTSYINA